MEIKRKDTKLITIGIVAHIVDNEKVEIIEELLMNQPSPMKLKDGKKCIINIEGKGAYLASEYTAEKVVIIIENPLENKEYNIMGKEHMGRGVQFGDFIRNTHTGEYEFKANYTTQITEDVKNELIELLNYSTNKELIDVLTDSNSDYKDSMIKRLKKEYKGAIAELVYERALNKNYKLKCDCIGNEDEYPDADFDELVTNYDKCIKSLLDVIHDKIEIESTKLSNNDILQLAKALSTINELLLDYWN